MKRSRPLQVTVAAQSSETSPSISKPEPAPVLKSPPPETAAASKIADTKVSQAEPVATTAASIEVTVEKRDRRYHAACP